MVAYIDHFKLINDNYGHDIGDRALKIFANILKREFGERHTYRIGGDEFLIISDLDKATFRNRVDRCYIELKNKSIGRNYGYMKSSMGYVYGTPKNAEEMRAMLKAADDNLYESKETGRNKVTCTSFSYNHK